MEFYLLPQLWSSLQIMSSSSGLQPDAVSLLPYQCSMPLRSLPQSINQPCCPASKSILLLPSNQPALPSIIPSQTATRKNLPWKSFMSSLGFPSLYFLLKAHFHSHSHSHRLPWFSLFWDLDAQTILCNVLTGSLQPSLLQRLWAPLNIVNLDSYFHHEVSHWGSMPESSKKQQKSISLLIKQESQGTERLATMKSILTVGNPNMKVLHPLLLWL